MRNVILLLLALGGFQVLIAQPRTITGRVVDAADNEPLPGATVFLQGTGNGVLTDIDGNYSIEVSTGNVLEVTFVGYDVAQIVIGESDVYDISLSVEAQQLKDIVVTASGAETEREALGYAIQRVSTDDVLGSGETNFTTSLAAKVPGVQVIGSGGSPGASSSIRIRGTTTISGNASPLLVIDGVPFENSTGGNANDNNQFAFNSPNESVDQSNRGIDINPNDIAKITVLKGPSATAIYGVRAANGAILITTKGASGQIRSARPVISFNVRYGISQVNQLPSFQYRYSQGRPVNSGVRTRYGSHESTRPGVTAFSWGARLSDLEYDGADDYAYDRNGSLVLRGTGNGTPANAYRNADNFYVLGHVTDANLAVQGRIKGVNYYASVGHLLDYGVIPESSFQRVTTRLNLSTKVTNNLTVGLVSNYVFSRGNRVQRASNLSGTSLGLWRTSPSFDIGNGKTGREASNDESSYRLPTGETRSYRPGIYDNPFWSVNRNPYTDEVNRFFGSIYVNYQVRDYLRFNYRFGTDFFVENAQERIDLFSAGDTGRITDASENSANYNSDFSIVLTPPLGDRFSLDVTLGHNYFQQGSTSNIQVGTELASPGFYNIANAAQQQAFQITYRSRAIVGLFGDLNFGFNNYLFLNLSGRNDWSSTLNPEANSFFYPAAALGFVWSRLIPSLDNSPAFSFGKVRASWGRVGNDASAFGTDTYYPAARIQGDGFLSNPPASPFLGQTSLARSNVQGNPNIRPEFTTTIEVGTEFRFLRDRLTLDVTYYTSKTTDALFQVDVAPGTGFLQRTNNVAEIESQGIEAYVQGVILDANDFRLTTDLTFNTYENIVTRLAPGVERVQLGGFDTAGNFVAANQPFSVLQGSVWERTASGQFVVDTDGYPIVAEQQQVLGDPNPDFTVGARFTFSWKQLTLSTLIDVRKGGDILGLTTGVLDYFGVTERTGNLRERRGVLIEGIVRDRDEDDNPGPLDGTPNTTRIDYYPSPDENGEFASGATNEIFWVRYGFGGPGESNVFDGSWVRLRDISIGYSLPSRLLTRSRVSAVNFTLSGRNLFVFNNYPGIDPEVSLGGTGSNGIGLEYFNGPNTRGFNFTLSVTF